MLTTRNHRLAVQIQVLLAIMVMAFGVTVVRAEPPQKSINAIVQYLNTKSAGQQVLNAAHFGADYKGHQLVKVVGIPGKPDDFKVIYRYFWANDGITDLGFKCDKNGSVYGIDVEGTNAVVSQPFTVADFAIQALGQLLLNANANRMTAQDRQTAQQLINRADSRALLVFFLP